MSVERLRSRRFDVVVLGGMNASEFPRPGVGDVLEGAAVQDAMRALGVVHDQAEEAARERLLFLLATTRPRRSLTLLRQETDEEGEALRSSVFWDELLDVYRDPTDPEDGRGPVPERLLCERLAHDATRSAGVRVSRGVLSDPLVTSDLAANLGTVTASDIEAYLECPYAWFVGRVLRPGGGAVDVDLRLRGHVAHDALARFHRGLAEATGRKRVTPEGLECALEVARRAVARALEAAPRARSLEERRLLGSIERAVLGLVKRDATFLPSYEPAELEWAFGRHGDGIDLGGFLLAGRVDRIDTGPEGLMIIDYKSSTATPVARFPKEGKIQLQLYAVAASRVFGLPVSGALYRSLATPSDRGFALPGVVSPGIVRTDRRSAAEIDELLGAAVETARAVVEAMRAGEIAPRPEELRCTRCGFAGFCAGARR
jgi:RecB family exonuclease